MATSYMIGYEEHQERKHQQNMDTIGKALLIVLVLVTLSVFI